MKPGARGLSIERSLVIWVLVAALPPAVLLLIAVRALGFSPAATALMGLVLVLHVSLLAYYCQRRVAGQLHTLANLLEAIINGDYSLRGRRRDKTAAPPQASASDGAVQDLVVQINALADTLSTQRLEARESQLLLGKVIENIEIALFAVDRRGRITLSNRAFCQLLGASREQLLASTVEQWQLAPLLVARPEEPLDWQFPRKRGRFSIYRDQFIEDGRPHQLVVLRDVKLMLRGEEQQAWKKLIRVIGHEINNSLAPISSMSASLQKLVDRPDRADALREGLAVIHQRAAGLVALVSGYRELARQPEPNLAALDLGDVLAAVLTLYADYPVQLTTPASPCRVNGDRGQLEQVFINLLKNAWEAQVQAVAASQEVSALPIQIIMAPVSGEVAVSIIDNGTGITNPANLFVPFYTTKTRGSGIGLAISRQIVEAHGGELTLVSREDAPGCLARVTLPCLDLP